MGEWSFTPKATRIANKVCSDDPPYLSLIRTEGGGWQIEEHTLTATLQTDVHDSQSRCWLELDKLLNDNKD